MSPQILTPSLCRIRRQSCECLVDKNLRAKSSEKVPFPLNGLLTFRLLYYGLFTFDIQIYQARLGGRSAGAFSNFQLVSR